MLLLKENSPKLIRMKEGKPLDFVFSFILFLALLLVAVVILFASSLAIASDPDGTWLRLSGAASSFGERLIGMISANPIYIFPIIVVVLLSAYLIWRKFAG